MSARTHEKIMRTNIDNEETELIKSDLSDPIWSPYDAFGAADTMLEVLERANLLS